MPNIYDDDMDPHDIDWVEIPSPEQVAYEEWVEQEALKLPDEDVA